MNKATLKSIGLLLGFGLFSSAASAQSVAISAVRSSGYSFSGMAVDAATGAAYQINGYGPGHAYSGSTSPTSITRFADAASFDAGTGGVVVTSGVNLWGTYLAAQAGSVFGRSSGQSYPSWPTDALTSKISGTTGAVQGSTAVANMGGANGSETFDWGGFSGVNAMNDGTRLYVVGGDAATSNWRITTFDYNLNSLNSVSFGTTSPGWGFAINGYVFLGDSYNSTHISKRVNAATGAVNAVNFSLTGIGSGQVYLTNASYDAFNDALYLHNHQNNPGTFYKVADASTAFGVSAVPEPETYAMLLAGLGLLGFTARRRKGRAA